MISRIFDIVTDKNGVSNINRLPTLYKKYAVTYSIKSHLDFLPHPAKYFRKC